MDDPQKLKEAKAKYDDQVAKVLKKIPERKPEFVNTSGIPVARLYTPLDMEEFDYLQAIGHAGAIPLHPGGAAHRLPGALLDHAPVCRLRHRRGDQRALPLPAEVRARPACPWPSTSPPRSATTPTTPWPRARWARSGWPSTPSGTWSAFFRASPWTRCPPP